MRIVPISLPDASAFIDMIHRHNKRPSIAATIAAGLEHEGKLIGVVMAGRPVARALDDGMTLEVHRVATVEDAPRGSVSCLYQAMRRAAGALGYRKCITYTLSTESGASMRGAGWAQESFLKARGGWDCPSRPRRPTPADGIDKVRWSVCLGASNAKADLAPASGAQVQRLDGPELGAK